MLVTRHGDTENSRWPFRKYESSRKPDSPRMSDPYDNSLSTQPGWQGQYSSYLGQSETSGFSFDQGHGASESSQPRSVTGSGAAQLDVQVKREQSSPVAQRSGFDPLGLRRGTIPSPIAEQPELQGDQYTTKTGSSIHDGSNASAGTPHLSMGSNPPTSVSPAGMGPEHLVRQASQDESLGPLKEEDEEDMEDEDLAEGDMGHIPMTAAERTAARRKMKRFR